MPVIIPAHRALIPIDVSPFITESHRLDAAVMSQSSSRHSHHTPDTDPLRGGDRHSNLYHNDTPHSPAMSRARPGDWNTEAMILNHYSHIIKRDVDARANVFLQ